MTDKEKIIEEFKKSIWHDPSEEPKPMPVVLFGKFGDAMVLNCRVNVSNILNEQALMIQRYGAYLNSIQGWCYLKDILPKDDEKTIVNKS